MESLPMTYVNRPLKIWLVLAACGILMFFFFDHVWSASVDFSGHYSMVSRLYDHWHMPLNLGEMSTYPRLSYILAAGLSVLLKTPLISMQLIALLSVLLIWGSIAFAWGSLPNRAYIGSSILLTVLFILNYWLKLEVHGHELIGNFFYAQLVAQALVTLALAWALFSEKKDQSVLLRYFSLGGMILVAEQTHLTPAVELFGFLGLLVFADFFSTNQQKRWKFLGWGLGILMTLGGLILTSSAFKILVIISRNNGGLPLAYTPNLLSLAILCFLIILLSCILIIRWYLLTSLELRKTSLLLKYLGLFGLSISGLCLLQMIALKFGHGSEYACRKYALSLNTLLILDIALLPTIFIKSLWVQNDKDKNITVHYFKQLFPAVFVLLVFLTTFLPAPKYTDIQTLIPIERFAHDYYHVQMPKMPGMSNYALGLKPGNMDYLVSTGIFEASRGDPNVYSILMKRTIIDPSRVGRLLTAENSIWDLPQCRVHVSPDSLVVLDGACMMVNCQPKMDFGPNGFIPATMLSGFEVPESTGRWSIMKEGSFQCKLTSIQPWNPKLLRISTYSFLPQDYTQRLLISLNGSKPLTYVFNKKKSSKIIEIPIPESVNGEILLKFTFPDAISPKEVGLADDPRKLAIGIQSIEFVSP